MKFKEYMDIAEDIAEGYLVAALTDEYVVDRWPMTYFDFSNKEEKILEIRIFNRDKEYKLVRSDITEDFIFRDSKCLEAMDSFSEIQYLDIDITKGINEDGKVTTTGGGKFYLPVENSNDACLEIINYISRYSDSGQARICDWRLAGIKEDK